MIAVRGLVDPRASVSGSGAARRTRKRPSTAPVPEARAL